MMSLMRFAIMSCDHSLQSAGGAEQVLQTEALDATERPSTLRRGLRDERMEKCCGMTRILRGEQWAHGRRAAQAARCALGAFMRHGGKCNSHQARS